MVPLIGREQAGDQIEQRGLAGAVRPDQRVDFAGADLKARIGDGADAAEMSWRRRATSSTVPLSAFGRRKAGSGRPS